MYRKLLEIISLHFDVSITADRILCAGQIAEEDVVSPWVYDYTITTMALNGLNCPSFLFYTLSKGVR